MGKRKFAAVLAAAAAFLTFTASPASAWTLQISQPMSWGGGGGTSKGGPSCTGAECWAFPQPAGPSGAVSIDAENTFNLAVMPYGTVKAWGNGVDGDLGDGSTASSQTPVQVSGLANVVQTAGGDSDAIALECAVSCAIDGTVETWGNNAAGQLGNGTTGGDSTTAAQVSLPGPACAVDAGGFHMYALLCNGTVYAWGAGKYGQLGNSGGDSAVPVRVLTAPGVPLTGITAITSGNLFGLAEDSSGNWWAWGFNGFGQLCNGSTVNAKTPVPVPLLAGVTAVSAGGNVPTDGHTLALLPDGTVEACGDNADGQLGTGTIGGSSDVPVLVPGLSGVAAIAAGGAHSMALKSTGELDCWGANADGQVGNGTTTDAPSPVPVLSGVPSPAVPSDPSSVFSAGSMHSLALVG